MTDPRVREGGGVKVRRYASWMGLPFAPGSALSWLKHVWVAMAPGLHKALMRFRLVCWDLEVNRPHGRECGGRTCPACGYQHAGEDAVHIPVIKECPIYESIQSTVEHTLRSQDRDVCTFMREAPQASLASYGT